MPVSEYEVSPVVVGAEVGGSQKPPGTKLHQVFENGAAVFVWEMKQKMTAEYKGPIWIVKLVADFGHAARIDEIEEKRVVRVVGNGTARDIDAKSFDCAEIGRLEPSAVAAWSVDNELNI